jgi:heme exporter protein D
MHWNSFEEFVHMGGYGLYVWGAYAVTAAIMGGEAWMAKQRYRQALRGQDHEDQS